MKSIFSLLKRDVSSTLLTALDLSDGTFSSLENSMSEKENYQDLKSPTEF